ncbi:MAG: NeuD/PglB/VioB family sugar acetyltransferase [Planctomycetaceae bacterium]|jgi:sugar O-acyltransferase (sialic acid O-acetyltransferase NeuD family)|nr:NeuD/PglB/VioB family sugar acetyltransferase [Planctomycetaceae bacterium]
MLSIIGCGGHARSVADVILANGDNFLCFVDNNARPDEVIYGHPVLTTLPSEATRFHIAIGDNRRRSELALCYNTLQYSSVIASTATHGFQITIASGCFIAHRVHLGPETQIEEGTIINTGSVIEHEVSIGSFCHIAPHSTICGRTRIGHNVFIGAGSVIIDNISICDNVVIGANSTVIKNIDQPGVYIGSPVQRQ